jgi:translation initiation factor 3 subunit C
MSRFWAGDSSSGSDSSSDSDSSDYSSEEEDRNKAGGNRWVDMSDSSDSDDEVRVVKSAKERALELFQKHISAIRNAMKVRDYYEIQCQFDELSKAMIKNKKTLAEGVPRPLIRILVELEDYVPERLADKAAFKKLSARQGRALNRMKLTLKKHNKPFEMLMEEYRKNPVEDDDEDDDGDDGSDSDSSDSDDSSSSSSSSSGGSDKKKKGGDDSVRCFCVVSCWKEGASRGCPFIRIKRIEFLVSDRQAVARFNICRCQSGKNWAIDSCT